MSQQPSFNGLRPVFEIGGRILFNADTRELSDLRGHCPRQSLSTEQAGLLFCLARSPFIIVRYNCLDRSAVSAATQLNNTRTVHALNRALWQIDPACAHIRVIPRLGYVLIATAMQRSRT
ncbi:hypothetical protein AAGS40_29760 (plasmid) [Paraburkholderia sp. PREW-6R]|uniref:hypothetical protein n=1 Tax=Paraburkholderia sp. PREW-6R TaxID=3141544 RepID=UPI0031F529CC